MSSAITRKKTHPRYRNKKKQETKKSKIVLRVVTAFLGGIFLFIKELSLFIESKLGKKNTRYACFATVILLAIFVMGQFNVPLSKPFVELSRETGFTLKAVTIDGQKEINLKKYAKTHLNRYKGDSIFDVDLTRLQKDLAKLSWVKTATVSRKLPDTILVLIEERKPVALWQLKGKLSVVDKDGVILTQRHAKKFSRLPIVIGKNAPKHVSEIVAILEETPKLNKRVTAMTWIGDRRWSVRLDNKTDIKLPEKDTAHAWQRFAKMEESSKIVKKNVVGVDLRLPDRVIIQERVSRSRSSNRS
ncbi:MAG: cell division protein FtsQ/DivIB [Alphaproteobacteria bacterium]